MEKKGSSFFELMIVVVSVDILHIALSLVAWLFFGGETDTAGLAAMSSESRVSAAILGTASMLISLLTLWLKLGTCILFFKKVPMRLAPPTIIQTLKKLWVMAFFWPIVLSTLKR